MFTVAQILLTTVIFIVTLTVAGPAFPIIIIALVPIRLTMMNRVWSRATLRHVDAWACREGCPEDDEEGTNVEPAVTDLEQSIPNSDPEKVPPDKRD